MSEKKLTKKHRRAIAKAMRGKELTDEHRAAIGAGVRKSATNKVPLGLRWDTEVDKLARDRAAAEGRPLVSIVEDAVRLYVANNQGVPPRSEA